MSTLIIIGMASLVGIAWEEGNKIYQNVKDRKARHAMGYHVLTHRR